MTPVGKDGSAITLSPGQSTIVELKPFEVAIWESSVDAHLRSQTASGSTTADRRDLH
jgi:hypothetical protein